MENATDVFLVGLVLQLIQTANLYRVPAYNLSMQGSMYCTAMDLIPCGHHFVLLLSIMNEVCSHCL